MIIDLIEAEQAVANLKAELGLNRQASCIEIILWHHASGDRELMVRITVFSNANQCFQHTGTTWQIALEKVKIEFLARSVDPGPQPIVVEVER